MAEWIDTEEATQLTGYHIDHIRLLLRQKKIAAKKKGGAYWIDKRSLLAYAAATGASEDKRHGARSRSASATK